MNEQILKNEMRLIIAFYQCCQDAKTTHDGSLSTGHANSAGDMLARLETMILMGMDLPLPAIRGQLASGIDIIVHLGIDIIVHLGRLRDRSRKVLQIAEILPLKGNAIETNILYEFNEEGEDKYGNIIGTLGKKNELINISKLKAAGIK